MIEVGYTLSSEDHGPLELVAHAQAAEQAGFRAVVISDHYHPWVSEQGNSPFVWSVVGGVAATTSLRLGTAVTCPTLRLHPAVVAQAAATAQVMLKGRFFLGVGSGEALNEHITGDRWPEADERLEMLEEAVEVMRLLWQGGAQSHRGRHYRVENAQLFTLPDEPPPIHVSAFGPKAAELAGRIGDGYVGTSPDAELISAFRENGGGDRPAIAAAKCCWGSDEAEARQMAHRIWPNLGLPGELAQILPTPAHFEQAAELVTEEMVADPMPCGPDPETYVESLRQFADAGYDEVYLHNIGPDQEGFLQFFQRSVRPLLS
jgi:G6PDH family F420-dependent oxidoreductase